jgi:repressor LexA
MKTIAEKIRAIMDAADLTQMEIAERFEVSQSTVNRWLTGSEPEGHRRDAINAAYERLIDEGPAEADGSTVKIMGYIGAGAEIMPEFEQVPPEGLNQVHVPFPLPAEMLALEVRGDSMLPVYKDGHVIIVYKEQKRPTTAFFGEEAAVRTSDGRRFLKTIMRGAGNAVTLMSFNAAPIEDIQLEWIGEIFATIPRLQVRKIEKVGGIQGRLNIG